MVERMNESAKEKCDRGHDFFRFKIRISIFSAPVRVTHKKNKPKKKKKKMPPRKPDTEAAKENAMLTHLAATAIKGDPASVLDTIDKFCWEGNWMVACDSRDETEMELLGLDGTLAACA
jgi:hypothetical protein